METLKSPFLHPLYDPKN